MRENEALAVSEGGRAELRNVQNRSGYGTLRGDPAPGKPKTLVVTYTAGGPESTIFTAEGQVRREAAATAAVAVVRPRATLSIMCCRRLRR